MSPRSPSFFAVALASALVLAPVSAWAGADDSAAADVLFEDGKALMKANNATEACPKFEASYKLDAKLGTLLNLADCFETVGRTGSAWHRFDEAVVWAEREHDDRASFAKERRDKLAPVLAKVRIQVTAQTVEGKALTVFRDAIPLDEAAVGAAVVVDPGPIEITVRRGDELIEKRSVAAQPGRDEPVLLDLDALAKAHVEVKVSTPGAKRQRVAAFVVGGVGLAGLTSFAIIEGVAVSKSGQADGEGGCKDNLCTPSGYAMKRRAGDIAEAGQWVGVVSGAVTAVGLTLFLTVPKPKPAKNAASLTILPYASPTGAGVSAGGTF